MLKTGKDVLDSVLKTARLNQIGIRSALDTSMRPALRCALEGQLHELDSIETEAQSIATQRGWDLEEPDPALCFFTGKMLRIRLRGRDTDSKIADAMIRQSTTGLISGLKDIHRFQGRDAQIRILSQKLLDCETAGIRLMQNFL